MGNAYQVEVMMGIQLQKFLRILSPGIILIFFYCIQSASDYSSAYKSIAEMEFEFTKVTLPLVLMIVFGLINYQFIRPVFMADIWREIDYQIKISFIKIAKLNDSESYKLLATKKRLIRAFFKIIDSDSSLKETSDKVRINGLILTSLIDVKIYSTIFLLLCLIQLAQVTQEFDLLLTKTGIFLFFIFISDRLTKYYKDIHIQLGSDQIDELRAHHNQQVLEKVNELLQDVP